MQTHWVEHYNRVTGAWMPVTHRSTREGANALARVQCGNFNSGTRVVRVCAESMTETVTDEYHL